MGVCIGLCSSVHNRVGLDKRKERRLISGKNFVLKICKVDKQRILWPYLQHIHTLADEFDQRIEALHESGDLKL